MRGGEAAAARGGALGCSVALHVVLLGVLLVVPLLGRGGGVKGEEEWMFVDFTVAVPGGEAGGEAGAEEEEEEERVVEEEEVEEEEIPEVAVGGGEKVRVDIRQNRRVKHWGGEARPPRGEALSRAEIEKLLLAGARISEATRVPGDAGVRALAAYYNHVRETFHGAWAQPGRGGGGGLRAMATVWVEKDGGVRSGELTEPSGDAAMDASVREVLGLVRKLKPLPEGVEGPKGITITFELEG